MMLLNDVYMKAEYECNKENKDRLLSVLRAFNKDEPTRKRFVQEMISWSAKFGDLERGDPELHHEAGKMYAEGINSLHPLLPRLHIKLRLSPSFYHYIQPH